MQCHYYDAELCRSCTHLPVPYAEQVRAKQQRAEQALAPVAGPALTWLEPWRNAEQGFRNRAKMVAGGTREHPTLGILDEAGRGVDLQGCPLHEPVIVAALPHVAEMIRRAGLIPYSLRAKQGELKHVLVTASPAGELMIRFVLRSTDQLRRLRRALPTLLEALPHLRVVSANLLPEHKAVLEGEEEILLAGDPTLAMDLGALTLHLRPQGFFQTSTAAAVALYEQARTWAQQVLPGASDPTVWDLYCGVGGFALHCAAPAGPATRAVGVEISAEAVEAARRSAREAQVDARFEAGDATAWARAHLEAGRGADLVVVNPPRRGIGEDLCALLDGAAGSGVRHLIYSSCNVDSLAKDLARMPSWQAVQARVVDMFPHTAHMEVIALLDARRERPRPCPGTGSSGARSGQQRQQVSPMTS